MNTIEFWLNKKNQSMKTLEKIKNYLKLFSIKRDEAIYTCLQNNIPLTNENIKEVMEIVKQKEQHKILKNFNKKQSLNKLL